MNSFDKEVRPNVLMLLTIAAFIMLVATTVYMNVFHDHVMWRHDREDIGLSLVIHGGKNWDVGRPAYLTIKSRDVKNKLQIGYLVDKQEIASDSLDVLVISSHHLVVLREKHRPNVVVAISQLNGRECWPAVIGSDVDAWPTLSLLLRQAVPEVDWAKLTSVPIHEGQSIH